ncbi:EF-P 5-aminopentanol modification-associated protein YfmF [Gudongella sp. DL1XJH-153]|uniref:EF-P 5-aminopentanol modification-associated protein YfmF n=1 Tax=Gudongella sp. DL1XJH-153 TaxID=3409804 RepID=UPI003BB7DF47
MESQRKKIGNGVHINSTYTDKFKSNYLGVYIIRPLDREEVTLNSLLPTVLNRGTKNYPSTLRMERKLENLFGANLKINSSRRGERQIIKISMEWADGRYTGEEGLDKDVLQMVKEVLFDPYTEEGVFSKNYIEQEKKNLKTRINNKINDKRSYSINRCIEEMCKGEKFSIYPNGYVEDVDGIDENILYDHYRNILLTSQIEIVYTGHDNKMNLEELMPKEILERENITYVPREVIIEKSQNKNQVREKMQVNQGKLVLGYRTGIRYEDSLYNGLLLGNEIFGGGPNSLLFRNVREKHSLAYYVTSSIVKHKSIVLLDAGIEYNNYQKTVDLINEALQDMVKGNFSEEDMEIAKKSIRTSSESIIDNPQLVSEFVFGKIISNDDRSLEEMIKQLEDVTRNDVIDAMSRVNLDTIYFMYGPNREVQNEKNKK